MRAILAAATLSALLLASAGCGDDGGGDLCSRYEGALRACNLLTQGDLACSIDADASGRTTCYLGCMESASCQDLQALFCRSSLPSAATLSCAAACDDLSSGSDFTCGDGDTISGSWKCDGDEDCSDGSDELGCPTFQCADGDTVPADFRCDAWADCADASDEQGCTNLYQCADGETTSADARCDGWEECTDGSDEAGCPQMAEFVCQ